MLKNAHKEVEYRLAKWVFRNLEKEQILESDEVEKIWLELLSIYDPPTKSVEVVTGTFGGDVDG